MGRKARPLSEEGPVSFRVRGVACLNPTHHSNGVGYQYGSNLSLALPDGMPAMLRKNYDDDVWRPLEKAVLYFFCVSSLLSAALTGQNAQSHKTVATCGSGQHPATWMQCPVDGLPDRPGGACQEVSVCLPNCPEGYQQLSGSIDSLVGKPSCVLAENTHSTCSPLNFQLVRRAALLVWYLRGEISERCALSHLRTAIEPVTVEVA